MPGGSLVYVEHDPTPALAPFAQCLWTLSGGGGAMGDPQPVVPDGCTELVFNLADPFERFRLDGSFVERQPRALLVGPSATSVVIVATGAVDLIGIRLHPWAAGAFLGIPPLEVRDQLVSLTDATPVIERAAATMWQETTSDARLAAVVRALEKVAGQRARPEPALRAAVRLLTGSSAPRSLGDLADRLGKSVRWLQRRFEHDVGLGPKLLARVARVQRAIRLAQQSPSSSWGAVAALAGYFDQSHLVRDFREIAGFTPTDLSTRGGELTQAFLEKEPRRPEA